MNKSNDKVTEMFNSDLDVFARTGFPQTAERIKEALRQKDEEIQTLRAALEQMKPNVTIKGL